MPANYDIKVYQGDSYTLSFTMNGDYTSQTFSMGVAASLTAAPTLSLSEGAGGIGKAYSGVTGLTTITVSITSAQTASLSSSTIYSYDLQMAVGTNVTTLLFGSFTLTEQVTP